MMDRNRRLIGLGANGSHGSGGETVKAVAFDASSESHTGSTGSASEPSFTWNHTPVGTPMGVVVFVITFNSATTLATSVTYGGTAMTAVVGGEASDAAGEPGNCKAYFLGSSVPTGVKAIVVNRTNNATVMYAIAFTVTANGDTETTGIVLQEGDAQLTEVNVDDGRTTGTSQRFAGAFCGLDALGNITEGPNSTSIANLGIDIGLNVAKAVYETIPGFGSRPVGFEMVSSDDVAAVHLAVRQV